MSIIGYILLFYIGFYFYRLAENHNKSKWVYGFLGIILFFAGLLGYAMFERFSKSEEINEFDVAIISIKAVFVGVFIAFIVFQSLDSIWERKRNKK